MNYKFRTISTLFSLLFFCFSIHSEAQYLKITTIAGNGTIGYTGNGGAAVNAEMNDPISITLDKYGNVYFVDYTNFVVRRISTSGIITVYAGDHNGGYTGNGGAATSADMWPNGIVMDKNDNLYISELSHDVIRKVTPTGIINIFAGIGEIGYTGDDSAALNCRMNAPFGMAIDDTGNLYFADAGNNVIRKINQLGIITTVAGNGLPGYSGDGLGATFASLDSPYDVAVDKHGNLFISDTKNNVIRKVSAATGLISTYAGTGTGGYNFDSVLATTADLDHPSGIAVDTVGNLYIADSHNNLVRKVDTNDFMMRLAGNRTAGYCCDTIVAIGSTLYNPSAVAVDTFGNLYIADANNQRIRKTYMTLGVENINSLTKVNIFPNPFSGNIFVDGLVNGDKVSLFNIIGKQVSDVFSINNAGENTITVSENLPSGIYMLQVWDRQGNKKSVERVVKQ